MEGSIITREADLEAPRGNRKHKLDVHQKRITKKSCKYNSSHSFSKEAPTQMPPLSQDTTWDTNQLRRNHVGQFVLPSLDSYTSSCMLMHLRGKQRLRSQYGAVDAEEVRRVQRPRPAIAPASRVSKLMTFSTKKICRRADNVNTRPQSDTV